MLDLLSPLVAFAIGSAIIGVAVLLLLPVRKMIQEITAPIVTKPLMNKPEQRLYQLLRQIVTDRLPRGYEVMSQVSYGEFLKCKDNKVRGTFNSKRADFLIIKTDRNPFAVIEYQGSGHYGRSAKSRQNAEKRDRVKRKTLSAAGVPMIEVPPKFTRESVQNLIEVALGIKAEAGTPGPGNVDGV